MMTALLLAIQFLTIIPIRINNIKEKQLQDAVIYFPVAGLLIGLLLNLSGRIFLLVNMGYLSANIALVVLLIILTRGIHLDGLADTTDALLSFRHKDEMLKIMRQPDIGVMGVLAMISAILLKIAFIYSINLALLPVSLLLMCALSRWALVFAMFLFPYARQEGKAKIFIEGTNFKRFALATILAIACVMIVSGPKGLLIFAVTALSAYAIGNYISKRIGGITGDTLGTINEATEIIILLTVIVMERSNAWMT